MGAELIPLLVIVAVFYFLLIRPGQQRAKAVKVTLAALEPGVKVMTTSGLYATVVEVDDDAVMLETSPGVESRWSKAAVAKTLGEDPDFFVEDVDGVSSTEGIDGTDPDALGSQEPVALSDPTADAGRLDDGTRRADDSV